jgi:hypothetical protein
MVEAPGTVGKTGPIPIFEKELERVHAAIEDYGRESPSHIAIIADPFAGQGMLFSHIREQYAERVVHLPLFSVVRSKDFTSGFYGSQDIVLMERCHFLALRRIGGFAMLDVFLDALSTSEKIFITGWNTFSWSYLSAVRHIETFFPNIVHLPRLDSTTLKTLILSQYDRRIEFIDDTEKKEEPFFAMETAAYTLPLAGREITLPVPRINPDALRRPQGNGTKDLEDVVFDKINRIAEGNFGVAQRIWEESLDGSTIRLSGIPDAPCAVNLDINEAFLLNIVLSMESISSTDLGEIAGPEINLEQTLYRLTNQGLVEEDRGFYRVRPEALNCVIAYLRKIRMVW